MKEILIELLSRELRLPEREVENMIEIPQNSSLGDYAFPCFSLAKSLKSNPLLIAEDLAENLRRKIPKEISSVDFRGGYVNFFIDKKILVKEVFEKVEKKDFGMNNDGKGRKIVIDMSSPNIAKPFGIGHLRSTIIGNSIGKICSANGYNVIKINYLGDWGTGFGRLIFGFRKFGSEEKLKKNPIKHLLEVYVKASSEEYDGESRNEFKKLEEGDKENLKLWKKFKELSMKEFGEIYDMFGVEFDVISGDSEYNEKMDGVIKELEQKKLLVEDDGAKIVNLKKEGLGVVLIQKSDGTSLYSTRDLAAAIDRYEKYKFHRIIYEVGQEQKLHFRQLFRVLELMKYLWAKNCVHAYHGLYLDKDGKKFSTRKGKTIFMKDILYEVIKKAAKNLTDREKLSKKELEKRSMKVALAAIIYGDIKNPKENNVVFDVDRFLSFEGDTGPYLLYSYARANSISRRVKKKKAVKIIDLKDSEIELLKKINRFPEVARKSYENLAPNLIANYSFELCKLFNEFYHSCPVLGSIEEGFRLKLVEAFRITLKKSLGLIGIDVLEEM